MKVGDLVKNSLGFVGIIVGINPLDDRLMVLWSNLAFAYPALEWELEVISESRCPRLCEAGFKKWLSMHRACSGAPGVRSHAHDRVQDFMEF